MDLATVIEAAMALAPGTFLRTLDAIHLATALLVGDDLRTVVTYDARMIEAAHALGPAVQSPS
jgi:predicted nucleic acid-binding protein